MHSHSSSEQAPRWPLAWLSSKNRQRLFIIMSGSALVLGVLGFLQLHAAPEHHSSWRDVLNALYHTMQLFLLHTPLFASPVPPVLEVARWLAAATTLLAGATVVGQLFRGEMAEWRLSRMNDHVIVCGLGRKGMAHVRDLEAQKRKIVVIENAPEPSHAEECYRLRVPIVIGDATRAGSLMEARADTAAELCAFCPDDSTNCEVAAQASHVKRPPSANRLKCHIQLGDVDLRAVLQDAHADHSHGAPPLCFRFFDVFEPEARRMLAHDLPLDHDGVPFDSKLQVHLVILGFGRMGRTLAVRAAQLGCFANRLPLRISVIDRDANRQRDALLFRHRYIEQVCKMDFHAIEAISIRTRELLETWCAEPDCLTSVAVCSDDEPHALELATQLLPLMERTGSRLAIRLAGESGLAHLFSAMPGKTEGLHRTIRVFGMEARWHETFTPGTDPNETFARRIHAEYERITKPETKPADAGAGCEDAELAAWLDLPEDFRESSRQQAAHIFIKLRAIGCEAVQLTDPRPAITHFAEKELAALSEWEHERWMCERKVANWTYKEGKKDPVQRTNSNLVGWSELTEEIQGYDTTFVRLIPELLKAAGKKICRRSSAP